MISWQKGPNETFHFIHPHKESPIRQDVSMTLPLEVLKKYLSDTFVETGTYVGGCVELALAAGFLRVLSIENDCSLFEVAAFRFKNNDAVQLFCGDSPKLIPEILRGCDRKCTFWLDAHQMSGTVCPLLEELDAIYGLSQNNHTIMIDDRRCWKNQWGISEEDVKNKLLNINPLYSLKYETNAIQVDDILVATLELT